MTCATLAAMATAVTVLMQPTAGPIPGAERDTMTMHAEDGLRATLCYYNHEAQVSVARTREITAGDLTVAFTVVVGSGRHEHVTVTPPDGWMVWPPEDATQSILDGDAGTWTLIRPMM